MKNAVWDEYRELLQTRRKIMEIDPESVSRKFLIHGPWNYALNYFALSFAYALGNTVEIYDKTDVNTLEKIDAVFNQIEKKSNLTLLFMHLDEILSAASEHIYDSTATRQRYAAFTSRLDRLKFSQASINVIYLSWMPEDFVDGFISPHRIDETLMPPPLSFDEAKEGLRTFLAPGVEITGDLIKRAQGFGRDAVDLCLRTDKPFATGAEAKKRFETFSYELDFYAKLNDSLAREIRRVRETAAGSAERIEALETSRSFGDDFNSSDFTIEQARALTVGKSFEQIIELVRINAFEKPRWTMTLLKAALKGIESEKDSTLKATHRFIAHALLNFYVHPTVPRRADDSLQMETDFLQGDRAEIFRLAADLVPPLLMHKTERKLQLLEALCESRASELFLSSWNYVTNRFDKPCVDFLSERIDRGDGAVGEALFKNIRYDFTPMSYEIYLKNFFATGTDTENWHGRFEVFKRVEDQLSTTRGSWVSDDMTFDENCQITGSKVAFKRLHLDPKQIGSIALNWLMELRVKYEPYSDYESYLGCVARECGYQVPERSA